MARYTLLHDTHQLGLLRCKAPFKARDPAEEKRLWIVEYRQRIIDKYKAMAGEDLINGIKWNLNEMY